MSSLMASHDLHLMMVELIIDKLFVPKLTVFDSAIIKKTVIMYRLLDDNWTLLDSEYETVQSNDSNNEEQNFRRGKSVVFAIPEADLKCTDTFNLDIDVQVYKENPKYIEMDRYHYVGFIQIQIDSLFYGIIKEINERKEMEHFFTYYHPREPISRSMKKTYTIEGNPELNEPALISIYTRLSYFGKSIITEIKAITDSEFDVREETSEGQSYRCLELSHEQLEAGCLGVKSFQPSAELRNLICVCDMSIQSGVKAITKSVNTYKHQQQKQQNQEQDQDDSSIEWKEIPYDVLLNGMKKKVIMENSDDENSFPSYAGAAAFDAFTVGMRNKQNNNDNNNGRMKNTERMGKLKRSTGEKDDALGRGKVKGKRKRKGKEKEKKSKGTKEENLLDKPSEWALQLKGHTPLDLTVKDEDTRLTNNRKPEGKRRNHVTTDKSESGREFKRAKQKVFVGGDKFNEVDESVKYSRDHSENGSTGESFGYDYRSNDRDKEVRMINNDETFLESSLTSRKNLMNKSFKLKNSDGGNYGNRYKNVIDGGGEYDSEDVTRNDRQEDIEASNDIYRGNNKGNKKNIRNKLIDRKENVVENTVGKNLIKDEEFYGKKMNATNMSIDEDKNNNILINNKMLPRKYKNSKRGNLIKDRGYESFNRDFDKKWGNANENDKSIDRGLQRRKISMDGRVDEVGNQESSEKDIKVVTEAGNKLIDRESRNKNRKRRKKYKNAANKLIDERRPVGKKSDGDESYEDESRREIKNFSVDKVGGKKLEGIERVAAREMGMQKQQQLRKRELGSAKLKINVVRKKIRQINRPTGVITIGLENKNNTCSRFYSEIPLWPTLCQPCSYICYCYCFCPVICYDFKLLCQLSYHCF